MSPKELTAFRMAPDVMKALRAVRAKEGIPISVQVDFAVRAWLRRKGVKVAAIQVELERRKKSGRRRQDGGTAPDARSGH